MLANPLPTTGHKVHHQNDKIIQYEPAIHDLLLHNQIIIWLMIQWICPFPFLYQLVDQSP